MPKISSLELCRTISDIMRGADLATLSSKKIRILCEKKFGVDLTSRRKEIDEIVMSFLENERSDDENNSEKSMSETSDSSDSDDSSHSGNSSVADSESSSDEDTSLKDDDKRVQRKSPQKVLAKGKLNAPTKSMQSKKAPAKSVRSKNASTKRTQSKNAPTKSMQSKKAPTKSMQSKNASTKSTQSKKKQGLLNNNSTKEESPSEESSVLDDAAVARKLQAEEWNFRRRAVKRVPKEVSKKKDKSGEAKKKKATSYTRKCMLSPQLAEVMQTNEMARHDVVKKMWDIVKERNLLDPSNKRYAICDEQLLKVFGKARFLMFGMMKYLKNHIKDVN